MQRYPERPAHIRAGGRGATPGPRRRGIFRWAAVPGFLVVVSAAVPRAAEPGAESSWIRCLESASEARQASACADDAARAERFTVETLEQIRQIAATRPKAVASFLDTWWDSVPEKVRQDRPRASGAALLLSADLLAGLGRFDEAAERGLEALALDPGTHRARAYGWGGAVRYAVDLDAGDRRVERVARILEAAGRRETAEALVARMRTWDPAAGSGTGGGVPVEATPWYPMLPEAEVPLLEGGAVSVRRFGGKVLLLDFWASWCGPCIQELPHLEALYRQWRERGLVALAVNADEPETIARRAAETLGLTVPVGRFTPELDKIFQVRTLPTLVLVDADGRVRMRWNGYAPGLERTIAAVVERLMTHGEDPGAEIVGRQRSGRPEWHAVWSRQLTAAVEGLAVSGGDEPMLLAAGKGRLQILRWDGSSLGSLTVSREVAMLRARRPPGRNSWNFLGFRPGMRRAAVLHERRGKQAWIRFPADLMDVRWRSLPPEAEGRGMAATLEGVAEFREQQGEFDARIVSGRSPAYSVAPSPEAGVWAVSAGNPASLILHEDGGERVLAGPESVEPPRWLLPLGRDGMVTFPEAVRAFCDGEFFADGRRAVAAATRSGALVVFDVASGEVRARFHWPDAAALATLPLPEGDALVVASGRRVTVVRPRGRSAAASSGP